MMPARAKSNLFKKILISYAVDAKGKWLGVAWGVRRECHPLTPLPLRKKLSPGLDLGFQFFFYFVFLHKVGSLSDIKLSPLIKYPMTKLETSTPLIHSIKVLRSLWEGVGRVLSHDFILKRSLKDSSWLKIERQS